MHGTVARLISFAAMTAVAGDYFALRGYYFALRID
jgi:hypothetical protein